MNCPKCKEEINHVLVYSNCAQSGTLDGNTIIDWNSVEVLDLRYIACPECDEEITDAVNYSEGGQELEEKPDLLPGKDRPLADREGYE